MRRIVQLEGRVKPYSDMTKDLWADVENKMKMQA